jgi:hypothetical protein
LQDAATLQWRPPAENGAAISCYQLEVDDGRQGEFRLAYTGMDTQCVVQKLQSGLNYRFRLRAENSVSRPLHQVALLTSLLQPQLLMYVAVAESTSTP